LNTRKLAVIAIIALSLLAVAGLALAGSYSSSPGVPIPDGNFSGVSDTITVGDTGTVTGITVAVNITHTYIGDLIIRLQSPSGTAVYLFYQQCGAEDNINVTFADGVPAAGCGSGDWQSGGAVAPEQALSAFVGEPVQGDWRLTVADIGNLDVGTLNSWTLNINIVPQINDGRLNRYDVAAPVAVYPDGDDLTVYGIDPASGQGTFTGRITAEMLAPQMVQNYQTSQIANLYTGATITIYHLPTGEVQFTPPPAVPVGLTENLLLWEGVHPATGAAITLHRLTSGELQITVANVAGGEPYIFIWTP
jgi:subtilisin-like proprotein convertase family protein